MSLKLAFNPIVAQFDLVQNIPATPADPTTKYLNGLLQWAEIVLGSGSMQFTFDGGGAVPSTSDIASGFIGCAGTITGWKVREVSTEAGVSSSASWTVKNNGVAISGTEKPALSSQVENSDLSLTTWTTAFSKGDRFTLVPVSYTTGTKFIVTIFYTASS